VRIDLRFVLGQREDLGSAAMPSTATRTPADRGDAPSCSRPAHRIRSLGYDAIIAFAQSLCRFTRRGQ